MEIKRFLDINEMSRDDIEEAKEEGYRMFEGLAISELITEITSQGAQGKSLFDFCEYLKKLE